MIKLNVSLSRIIHREFIMKIFSKILLMSVLLVFGNTAAFTQPPPSSSSNETPKVFKERSLKDAIKMDVFSSADGRFTISFPSQIGGYAGLTPKELGFDASGSAYSWRFQEGNAQIVFFDFGDAQAPNLKTEQDYVNYFAGAKDGTLKSFNGKLISEKRVKLGKVQGLRITFDLPNGVRAMNYSYIDGRRSYSLIGAYDPSDAENEKLFAEALETFKITDQTDIDTKMRRKIEAATPKPLPQEPAITRLTSDAEDDGLKGKVKKIVQESEDLSGKSAKQGRKLSTVEFFNEKGNYIKREYYDYRGNPSTITVYGYLDGKRVSKSGYISYEYNPPPPAAPNPNEKPKPKSDPRYSYEYISKYENEKLVEDQLFSNRELPLTKTVYKYDGNQIERLVYASDGSLNQRYVSVLDKDGHIIEQTNYDQTKSKHYGDRKYIYTYEFDQKGNWIKRMTSQEVVENGEKVLKPSYITYRTITYYE